MSIQYFEPRPPEVWAMQINSADNMVDRMKAVREFPGVSKVTVESSGNDELVFTIHPHEKCGKPIAIQGGWADGEWLVAVITQTGEWSYPRSIDVKLMNTATLNALYRPTEFGSVPACFAASGDSDVCAD